MSTSSPYLSTIPTTPDHETDKNEDMQSLLGPGSINPLQTSGGKGSMGNIAHGHTKWDIIRKGVGAVTLLIFASSIVFANDLIISKYGIDYADMLLLRSAVQIVILGIVLKCQGKILLYCLWYILN